MPSWKLAIFNPCLGSRSSTGRSGSGTHLGHSYPVASDIGARGLDILGVSHVINMDAPSQSMAYLHRVGRSARRAAHGQAVTIVTEQELRLIRRYEGELGILVKAMRLREGRMIPADGEPHRRR